jgi:ABC-type xylose transport system substrate-binding protein
VTVPIDVELRRAALAVVRAHRAWRKSKQRMAAVTNQIGLKAQVQKYGSDLTHAMQQLERLLARAPEFPAARNHEER